MNLDIKDLMRQSMPAVSIPKQLAYKSLKDRSLQLVSTSPQMIQNRLPRRSLVFAKPLSTLGRDLRLKNQKASEEMKEWTTQNTRG